PPDGPRGGQSPPGDNTSANGLPAVRSAEHGVVADVWVGQRQPGSAGLCCLDYSWQDRSTALLAAVGQRLPPLALSRRPVPGRQIASLVSGRPRRVVTR